MIFKRKNTTPATDKPLWVRIATYSGVVLLVFMLGLAWYWSRTPDVFWINEKADGDRVVTGYATTDTLMRVASTMLDKPGGYLSNDVMPPSVFLDNIPNWEVGVLQQVRDLARVMRNDYSRSQSQSSEDPDLAGAEPRFFIDHEKWMFPRAETEYRTAIKGFASYRDRLSGIGESEAQFFARADNLREWLSQVEKRLGSVTRRLGNSVATSVVNTDLAGDRAATANTAQRDIVDAKTSWFEIDDIFFEARGTSWALVHFFRAAQFDFADVLADKNAEASVRQIIKELEASLGPLRSPMIMNGGGFGLFANHSLVMANYMARANAAVINLRELLDQG
ncbi:MAG: DUF2333 domain-containing protein [Gammaproteobacteria bacterium]|nr:MAG: DUF2333 domain-containing protein [Gammaproteobacteria bacterium]